MTDFFIVRFSCAQDYLEIGQVQLRMMRELDSIPASRDLTEEEYKRRQEIKNTLDTAGILDISQVFKPWLLLQFKWCVYVCLCDPLTNRPVILFLFCFFLLKIISCLTNTPSRWDCGNLLCTS